VLLSRIATIAQQRGDLHGALEGHEEVVTIMRQLTAQVDDLTYVRDLSFGLSLVADLKLRSGDVEAARTGFEEALEVARRLAAELGTPLSRYDVGVLLTCIATIAQQRGDLHGALEGYEESVTIMRQLAAQVDDLSYVLYLSLGLSKVADLKLRSGDVEAARTGFAEALEICRLLVAETASLQDMNAFVWVTQLAATVEIAQGMPDAAIVLLELARRHAEGLEFFENTDVLDTAAVYWERHTEALDALARSSEASESRSRALAIRARIADMGSD
jgi:tetratricopeptide (TPR) repeat protein